MHIFSIYSYNRKCISWTYSVRHGGRMFLAIPSRPFAGKHFVRELRLDRGTVSWTLIYVHAILVVCAFCWVLVELKVCRARQLTRDLIGMVRRRGKRLNNLERVFEIQRGTLPTRPSLEVTNHMVSDNDSDSHEVLGRYRLLRRYLGWLSRRQSPGRGRHTFNDTWRLLVVHSVYVRTGECWKCHIISPLIFEIVYELVP